VITTLKRHRNISKSAEDVNTKGEDKNVRMARKGHFLEEDDCQDQCMGERGQRQAAVAGGHINMKARVVTSSGFFPDSSITLVKTLLI
jgi:hypothetical protein